MTQAEAEATTAHLRQAIAACAEVLLRHALVEVVADSPGWIDSGINLQAGDTVSLLATGSAHMAGNAGLSFAPQSLLWYRIRPGGQIAKFPAPTTTFTAPCGGRLEFVVNFPGAWLDPAGGLAPDWPRQAGAGAFVVAVLVWKGAAEQGLARLAAAGGGALAAAEHARRLAPARLPRGWQPLWRVGETEVYGEGAGGQHITCRCHADGGIIKHALDLPLDSSTRLAWSWRVAELPSRMREDATPSHDYLSIAVEFDNGQDLTYIWSAELPVGTAFRCPLPWWDKRETHQVVRSGGAELGRWLDEERPLLADYARAVGGPPPLRIVGVWLIAVAILQRGRGECDYRSIELRSARGVHAVGPG